MSARDIDLLTAIDMQYIELASIVNSSRQTVSKIVKSAEDFLTAAKLLNIFDHASKSSPEKCSLIQRAIEQHFPEYSTLIFDDVVKLPESGEFWFISPDFMQFKGRYLVCTQELIKIAKNNASNLAIFTQTIDYKTTLKFFNNGEHKGEDPAFVVACTQDIRLLPPLLLNRDENETIRLFAASSTGFTTVAPHDAVRIWSLLTELHREALEAIDGSSPVVS